MKNFNLFVIGFCALLCNACIESQPNDRAMFNLQGQVKTLSMENEDYDFREHVVFEEYTGTIAEDASNYSMNGSAVKYDYGRIEQVFEDESNCFMRTYEFDGKGRLIRYQSGEGQYDGDQRFIGLVPEKTVTYEYRGKERLPYKQAVVRNSGDESAKPVTTEGEIEYVKVDEAGNWLVRKWNGRVQEREITYYDSLAAVDNCPMEKRVDWQMVAQVLLAILLSAAVLAVLGHMIYENFFKRKLPEDCSVAKFSESRAASGCAATASPAENDRAQGCLDALYELWSPVSGAGTDEELRAPLRRKAIRQSHALWQQAVDERPTDEGTVVRLNECAAVLNQVEARSFTGSKTFLITSLVLAVLLAFIGDSFNILGLVGTSCVLYILASRKPVFMQIRSELSGKSGKPKFMSALFGGLFGMVATAKTYKTVTKWSDGTTTTDTDHSETWFSLAFALIVMLVLAFFMWAVALMNYLRNYILYY